MEKYSFEKAHEEANKIKSIADEINTGKIVRDYWEKTDEPSDEDYRNAEKLVDSGYEKNVISYKESLKQAKALLEKYDERILNEEYDAWDEDGIDGNQAIGKFIRALSPEILCEYTGHGVTRNSEMEQLAAALNISENKCIRGWQGLLAKSEFINAYTHGNFLIISKYKHSLCKLVDKKPIMHSAGWEAEIGAIIVNSHFYPLIPELREMFPDVKIIKANQFENHVMSEINEYKTKNKNKT